MDTLDLNNEEDKLAHVLGENKPKLEKIAPIFNNLFENKVVYHERFTCIVKLENIKILPNFFEATAIPYLKIEKERPDRFYPTKSWEFGSRWSILNIRDNVLSGYGSWVMWYDPDLVRTVEQLVLEKRFKEALELTLYTI